MGATVSIEKRAAAFKTADGTTIYSIFEKTYEANCYPHTPHWSCVAMGEIGHVLHRIFGAGASCEGGMLRVKGGAISPSAYITAWLEELANPMEMPDQSITLEVSRAFYATVPSEQLSKVVELLLRIGRSDVAGVITAGGTYAFDLHADHQLAIALYGNSTRLLAPWRAFKRTPHGPRRSDLGYAPSPAKASPHPVPKFMKLDGDTRLELQADGTWRVAGWEYAVIGQFVESLADNELLEPGSYRSCITAFRKALRDAPPVPSDATVVVDLSIPLESKYADARRQKLVDLHAAQLRIRKTARGHEMPHPDNAEDLYQLSSLPPECVFWEVPAPQAQLLLAA